MTGERRTLKNTHFMAQDIRKRIEDLETPKAKNGYIEEGMEEDDWQMSGVNILINVFT